MLRVVLIGALALGACADEGEDEVGHADPCVFPQAPLLGCPPPAASSDEPLRIDDACRQLVECGVIDLDDMDDEGDFAGCVARLTDYSPARLDFTLRCIEVSTCIDLRAGYDSPCFVFGGQR